MEYRVEEIAAAAGVPVDTLRFYQARGLLPPPARRGRRAVYGAEHLARLRRIRALRRQGFKLEQIQRLLPHPADSTRESLLAALVEEGVGERTLSREELAAEAGVPEGLIRGAEAAGLLQPLRLGGEERFGASDVELARAGLALLEAGFPLPALLEQAMAHARNVQGVCDAAIELFDRHVRRSGPGAGDPAAITAAFQRLLPQVTRIVALHFQRTLVNRALERLAGSDESEALSAALAAAESRRLEVEVSWR
jgi:DNA-binding transcriptional MerR regulator